ncbi:MAG: type II secretion system protein N [Phenylobacterium sp.]|uniref:type II secretion system protein N n=1 Tax=Phenylobacterium sp. TaxID=1871053 RepID=UPI0027307BDC|nr:type II secretion system protein N [Phenylobacterium sp.]MDP1618226.1 type II secretion system protein N [Phenylobacterium sp.]MDP1988874.1 type II secretion system protein N [Phenylobacterium sp.]MDP3384530.1 type II secretion system protein N [Phenylobacterium sp.]
MNLAAVRHGVALQPRTLLGLVEIALVLLLAVQAARLVWILIAPPSGPLGVPPASGAGAAAQTEILARFDPFFRLGGPTDAPVTAGSDLQLYGVRTGGASASAILGPPGGAQTLYFIGEQGPDGITLVEVADDHVVVRQGANRRRIGFPTPSGGAYVPPPQSSSAATTPEAAPDYTGAQLMAALALAPRMRDGRSAGYTVTPRGAQGAAILARAGLQPGDVLLTIDGSELNGERMSELPQILATATHVDLSYERGGQVMNTRLRMSAP